MDNRFAEHTKTTAMCVELALNGVEGDIRKELEATTGAAAEALSRVLDKLNERKKTVTDLVAVNQ